MCGWTWPSAPRACAHRSSRTASVDAEMRRPRVPTKSAFSPGTASCARTASQAVSASRAFAPTGTERVLLPLPVTVTRPSPRSSRPSPQSSDSNSARRNPEEYINSNIAWSRSSSMAPSGAASIRRCAASTERALGKVRGDFAARTPWQGLDANPFCRTSQ